MQVVQQMVRFSFTHSAESKPIYVYKMVWLGSEGWKDNPLPAFDTWKMRWEMMTRRESAPAATMILTMATGFENIEQADAAFDEFVLANCHLKD